MASDTNLQRSDQKQIAQAQIIDIRGMGSGYETSINYLRTTTGPRLVWDLPKRESYSLVNVQVKFECDDYWISSRLGYISLIGGTKLNSYNYFNRVDPENNMLFKELTQVAQFRLSDIDRSKLTMAVPLVNDENATIKVILWVSIVEYVVTQGSEEADKSYLLSWQYQCPRTNRYL